MVFDKSYKTLFNVLVLYFITLNIFYDIIQFNIILLLPSEFRLQAKVVVILSTLMKSSLIILLFVIIYIINRYLLYLADSKFHVVLINYAFCIMLILAIVVELIRLILAFSTLIPYANKYNITDFITYHNLITKKIPHSSWHIKQSFLINSFILIGPLFYSSYLFIKDKDKDKDKKLDILLSGLVIMTCLLLVRYVSI